MAFGAVEQANSSRFIEKVGTLQYADLSSSFTVDFKFIQDNAANILTTTPIDYLRSAELVGTAFHPSSPSPVVSSVFTNFWVDHAEPLQALDKYRRASAKNWPFGELLDGHEFLIIVRPS
ncbi:hypothetical protein DXG01_000939 [Tephrocybe rancida]|nr:hypothetical protein DXG01_000939 [Tephrocybe rancida]